ncbi:MAG TPA: hypothetical protein VNQ76_21365 [Planctomicrobium sp.]|nr:hypothetical protein [Planctomicrobium sp.]
MAWEGEANRAEQYWGEAPAEPQTMESVIFHAAQQELPPPGDCPS